jgi:ABC-type nitrate/sulfonate/bicarbonate transport system ATPase subunit
MTAATVKLSARGISKAFRLRGGRTIEAVRDVSFDVHENEFCVLLGPSGCGKSTVLRMIAGLEDPTGGLLELDGHEILRPDRERGMVFQSYTSFDWLTVQKNVEYGMKLNGVPAAERRERAARFIDLVKLTKFRDAYPKQLSGGMKQRVAIARALAVNPAVLLMDEPLSALDSQTRELLLDDLVSLWTREKFTACYVTHNLNEAVRLGHRVVVLSRRPGVIRDIVDIDMPLEDRTAKAAQLAEIQQTLWDMMRQEALSADMEIADD